MKKITADQEISGKSKQLKTIVELFTRLKEK
jgi:hypothetical protein